MHGGSCAKPTGVEQQRNCCDDDSSVVQGERNAETATNGKSTTTGLTPFFLCSTERSFECDRFTAFFAVAVNVAVIVIVVFAVV